MAVVGLTVTPMGTSVTVAVAAALVSATLVGVTTTVWLLEMVAGAVYKPEVESVPTDGFIVHVTLVFDVPVTVAVNCCDWPPERLAEPGLTCTEIPVATVTSIALSIGTSREAGLN